MLGWSSFSDLSSTGECDSTGGAVGSGVAASNIENSAEVMGIRASLDTFALTRVVYLHIDFMDAEVRPARAACPLGSFEPLSRGDLAERNAQTLGGGELARAPDRVQHRDDLEGQE